MNSASYVVLINGSPSQSFNGTRGLMQGCPLSPYLFLLIIEGLSLLMNKAKVENKIRRVKVTRHYLFVSYSFCG